MKRVSRPRLIGGAVVVVALAALGFVPIFAGPTYELALAAGILCPAVAAVVTSRELSDSAPDGFSCYARALTNGATLALLAYATTLLHGLRAGFCDLLEGTVLFALAPAVGMLLGGVWGAVAAELARRLAPASYKRSLASVVLALALPIAAIALELTLFYATPMVFAFDPFVGYFSGALYDTVLHDTGLLGYRAASAATLLSCYVAALHLGRDERGLLVPRSLGRPGLLTTGALAAIASVASVAFGSDLGHWQTADTIERSLGARLEVGRCRLIYDRRISADEAARAAHDCDGHVAAIAEWLEIVEPESITVYLFADLEQKRRLMGAARTSIAKPWRREIYLHHKGYPHDVLGHELVHALAGMIGHGPFDIAGSWGGLLPNPGLIEGIAMAGAPHDDELSADEWAAAMRRIEVLPRVESLFSLAFFGAASSTSYTAAGSFVGWLRESHGTDTLVRWYGGADLPELTGSSWDALEAAWWQSLETIELTPSALATARARFDRPGVLSRRCPHEVDELLAEAAGQQTSGDLEGAIASYRAALALDPGNVYAHFGVASCHDGLEAPSAARARLGELAEADVYTEAVQSQARERMGDLALRAGDAAEARRLYHQAKEGFTDEDRLRTIDIKSHYADQPEARAALVALLIGTTAQGPDEIEALDRIGRWRSSDPEDGTPDYLFARQHMGKASYALAAERLDRALASGLPVPRAESEALRLRLVSACALGDGDAAQAHLERYRDHPLVSPARVRTAERLLRRCSR